MTIQVHILQAGETVTDAPFIRLCPTRGQAVTTTTDHTDLLPTGDGFNLAIYDASHNLIWYRDVCPLDAFLTGIVASLPAQEAAAEADPNITALTGYARVNAIWLRLFSVYDQWLITHVVNPMFRSALQALLPTLILNWLRCAGSGTQVQEISSGNHAWMGRVQLE